MSTAASTFVAIQQANKQRKLTRDSRDARDKLRQRIDQTKRALMDAERASNKYRDAAQMAQTAKLFAVSDLTKAQDQLSHEKSERLNDQAAASASAKRAEAAESKLERAEAAKDEVAAKLEEATKAGAEASAAVKALEAEKQKLEAAMSNVAAEAKAAAADEIAALKAEVRKIEDAAGDVAAEAKADAVEEIASLKAEVQSLSEQLEAKVAAEEEIAAAKAGLLSAEGVIAAQLATAKSRAALGEDALEQLTAQHDSERQSVLQGFDASGKLATAAAALNKLNWEAVESLQKLDALKAEGDKDDEPKLMQWFGNWQREGALTSMESTLKAKRDKVQSAYSSLPELHAAASAEAEAVQAALSELQSKFEDEEHALPMSRAEIDAARAEVAALSSAAASLSAVAAA